jgi:hypothetical protein
MPAGHAAGARGDRVHRSSVLLLVVAADFAHSVDALGGVKQVGDDVVGVVGARHDEFVVDRTERRRDLAGGSAMTQYSEYGKVLCKQQDQHAMWSLFDLR